MGRWDIAEWRGPTPNHGGAMAEQRGLVVHIAEGSYEGTISWCKNPTSSVSSHFVVRADGHIAQVVDTDQVAWTQRDGNGHWLSVENEGHTPGALTPAQVEANARILAHGHAVYGYPLTLAGSPTGKGLGYHSMGAEHGYNWGHLDCPGPAIKAQLPAILARAIQIANGTQEDDMGFTQQQADDIAFTLLNADGKPLHVRLELLEQTLARVEQAIKTPTPVTVDRTALAAALQEPTFLQALAKAVNDDAAARLAG